jgi:hypothetical protein
MITKNINNIAKVLDGFINDALEGVVPPEILQKGRRTLNFALEFIQPHVVALGLRVARLSRTQAEIIIPDKERNLSPEGFILEGVVVTAAIEALRFLWEHNKPEGNFKQSIRGLELEVLKPFVGPLRLRVELSEILRESCYSDLATQQKNEHEVVAQVFDPSEQMVAQLHLSVRLALVPALEWT